MTSPRRIGSETGMGSIWKSEVAREIPSLHQPPGLAILLEAASVGGSAGIEVEASERREGSDRDDEPRVLQDDINSQKVNLIRSVRNGSPTLNSFCIHPVIAKGDETGGLYLHLPEPLPRAHHEIVTIAVAIRLGYVKPQALSLVDEGHLRQFALFLGSLTGTYLLLFLLKGSPPRGIGFGHKKAPDFAGASSFP